MRIGVLTDCQGPFRAFEEAELSGAELPLLARGAAFRGTAPTDGLTPATVRRPQGRARAGLRRDG